MNRILNLLKERNRCLAKFKHLNDTELKRFMSGNFEHLDHFYESRESILDMINYLDEELESESQKLSPESVDSDLKIKVRECLFEKESMIRDIVAQDLQVISVIETAKTGIIRELQDVQKGKKAVAGYKIGLNSKRVDQKV